MSETPLPLSDAAALVDGAPKRDRALRVIGEILRLMGVLAKLEAKDAADGGISVALEVEGDLAGIQPGKRSHVVDALQFLANKIVNRPGAERRWIAIGVGSHPEPRLRPPRRSPPPSPASAAPVPPTNGRLPAAAASRPSAELEEVGAVAEDAALSKASRHLAQKAGSLGRFYAIVGMSREDCVRVLKATAETDGAKVIAEGDGRNRRVVFVPDKPAPVPKKSLPADDEEE